MNELALAPLHMHGSEELKQKYMTRNASEPIVSAYCVTVGNRADFENSSFADPLLIRLLHFPIEIV